MFKLREQDEYIHPIGDDPAWREAVYFDCYDPETGLGALGYMGVHPRLEIGDQIFALWKGDVLVAKFTRWDFNIPSDIGEERFSFGPLQYSPRVPFQECDWRYDDGYCRLDITFRAIHQPYSWWESHQMFARTNSHHYEQQGTYRGTVRIGTQTYTVHGVGTRDHAWGWGVRERIKRWIWTSGQFHDGLAFNAFHLTLEANHDVLFGYIFRGRENVPLKRSVLNLKYDDKWKRPDRIGIHLVDDSGAHLIVEGRIINVFDISYQERNKKGFHFFCFTEYTCGVLRGYGQSNYYYVNDSLRPLSWEITS
ncbi:MAG: hypothetical protein D6723_16575 [Acidobacteria bacterium]|nr:MAG: hypothetical protein D6723_16575 [Acidobacteriota bacterium]